MEFCQVIDGMFSTKVSEMVDYPQTFYIESFV